MKDLTPSEKNKAQVGLMFLTEKRDKSIKGRLVYNGKPTREYLDREDTASPTAALESIMLTAIVDAKEERDVMMADLPNAFIQTELLEMKDGDKKMIMKITGVLVDLMVEMAAEVYGPYVVYEKGTKVIYVEVLRALYGMLVAALLWYKKLKGDLEEIGYEFNPYDACVANKTIHGKQHTLRVHVDDVMCSHVEPTVNDDFHQWLFFKYGKHNPVKAKRGKLHDYLGMMFNFTHKGKVIIDMIPHVQSLIDEFPETLQEDDTDSTPAGENLFKINEDSPDLAPEQAKKFHTCVYKGLFICKRTRPDIHTGIAALTTRIKKPNEDDWMKLRKMVRYLNGTKHEKLTLSADSLHVIKWYVDASLAVHPDFKSHTGGGMTMGVGFPITMSRKQKLNTKSSCEAELVGTDDISTLVLWTMLFMEAQGYEIEQNVLFEDNKSTILMVNNGKRSSGRNTRAFNIRYFS